MPEPNLSEITTMTLRERSRKLADNFTNNHVLLYKCKEKGNAYPFPGGRTIVDELSYQENSTYTRYSGYDNVSTQPSTVFSAAEYNIKQAAVTISISGLEQIQNRGRAASIDLMASRVKNAEGTFKNQLGQDFYSDGTADGGKQVVGLQAFVSTTPTNTVGGINAASFDFWKNFVVTQSTAGATWNTALITDALNRAHIGTARGNDTIDLFIAGNDFYNAYLSSLQGIQRITNAKMADAGYTTVKFMNADVVLDGYVGSGYAEIGGGNPNTTYCYGLNTDYLKYRPVAGRDMEPLDDGRSSTSQDAIVKILVWAGALTCSNRFLQCVIKPNN